MRIRHLAYRPMQKVPLHSREMERRNGHDSDIVCSEGPSGGLLRIVHAPSHRYNKGTDIILPAIERLKARFDFEFVLVEGLPQDECRKVKWTCDLCVDRIGNRGGTGYGISSLEMFAAGIPCLTDFTDFLSDSLPGHPRMRELYAGMGLKGY